jgi:hypothetical protein
MGNPTGRIFLMGTGMEWYYPTGMYPLPSLLMRPGRSPGARSGSEFLSWFVDVINSLAIAWCESSPRASARSERTIKDHLDFCCMPLRRLSARRKGGESAMLPSKGTEHGVSSELLTGDPSGRPSPVR